MNTLSTPRKKRTDLVLTVPIEVAEQYQSATPEERQRAEQALAQALHQTSRNVDAFLRSAGAWKDMTDEQEEQLINDIYTSRQMGSRNASEIRP